MCMVSYNICPKMGKNHFYISVCFVDRYGTFSCCNVVQLTWVQGVVSILSNVQKLKMSCSVGNQDIVFLIHITIISYENLR